MIFKLNGKREVQILIVRQRRNLMKTKFIVLFLIFLTAATLFAADEPVLIHNGFGTGQDYIKMSQPQKRAYAMGAINGMIIAPLWGAPKDKLGWLESYVENMTDEQVAAILSKYLQDNPGRWHEGLHILMYSAVKEAYDKNHSGGKK
jgi:hypothetical protein